MRVEDLHHKEILELDAKGGLIRFAGQRALLLDAVAMGVLRQYLFDNFGLNAARAVLTQFGFAHGWRMAEALQKEFVWLNNDEWRRAGPRIHTLGGLFSIQPGSEDPLSKKGAMLLASYEAEQHLLHFGRSELSVQDDGCGMTPDIRERIFDPYFTTKEKGSGTGLGLSVVRGIVNGCGGAIRVESDPKKGSEFLVYLPVIEKFLESEIEANVVVPGGNESILFVDDEPTILAMDGRCCDVWATT